MHALMDSVFREKIPMYTPMDGKRDDTWTVLTQQTSRRAIYIGDDDMIHIVWKHVTIQLNLTGLQYLARYLQQGCALRPCLRCFQLNGTADDGYQLWIQDIGLRLSPVDFQSFHHLLDSALDTLKRAGRVGTPLAHLPGDLALTTEASVSMAYSAN